jgi:PHF5-like protein
VAGISDAYYCAECTRLEKDRDGCPKIVNLGASRTDLFYERRRLGSRIFLPVSIVDKPFALARFQGSRKGRIQYLYE